MVVFTCNHCGDSLQKPRVEKHYSTTCSRNHKSLTCVDCLKDFRLEEYAAHTKCITETQRYSAKGTVIGTPKGEEKQESWAETVKNIAAEQKNIVAHNLKRVFEIMENSPNIPRKKKPFTNFMLSSSGRKINIKDIEAVWDILEKHTKKNSNSQQEPKTNGVNNEDKSKAIEEHPNENGDESAEITVGKKKKNKKSKGKKNNVNEPNEETTKTEDVETKKSKKKRKSNAEAAEITDDVPEKKLKTEELPEESPKKKKSKSKENNLNETNEDTTKTEEETTESVETKKSKKKRKSKHTEAAEISEEIPEKKLKTEDIVEESPKKKKKSKTEEIKSEEIKEPSPEDTEKSSEKKPAENGDTSVCKDMNGESKNKEIEENCIKKSGRFNWEETITKILQKKSDGMTEDKLENKVRKKFEKVKGPTENTHAFIRKYHKIVKSLTINDNGLIKLVA